MRRRRVVIGGSATGFGVCFLFFFSAESAEKESVEILRKKRKFWSDHVGKGRLQQRCGVFLRDSLKVL